MDAPNNCNCCSTEPNGDGSSPVKNESGFHIYGWMVNELHLKGLELVLYAIIHSYGASGTPVGGLRFFMAWTGFYDKPITRALSSLVSKGFLRMRGKEGDRRGKVYSVARSFNCISCPMRPPSATDKIVVGSTNIVESTKVVGNTTHSRTSDEQIVVESTKHKEIYKEIERKNKDIPRTHEENRPTVEDVRAFIKALLILPEADATHVAEQFYDGCESTGWVGRNGIPIRNWQAAARKYASSVAYSRAHRAQTVNLPQNTPRVQRNVY